MKKCLKCSNVYDDTLDQCPECRTPLISYTLEDTQKDRQEFSKQQIKKLIVFGSLVIVFLLGFGFKSCTGVKKADYKNLQSENEKLQAQYDELSTSKDDLQVEFDTYKTKMKPYEEQQAADEKAAIDEQNKKAAENARQAAEQKAKSEAHRENMYGISDKHISTINDALTVSNVRNDVTGNWRIVKTAANIQIEEYALDYYKNKFTSKNEIHWIVNFTNKTTTCISNVVGDRLSVVIHEYVDKEEHYADTLGSGMVLAEFSVYLNNGDIEKIK